MADERKRFLLLSRRAPHGSSASRELLDIPLLAAAFEHPVALALIDDGVYQLVAGQDTSGTCSHDFASLFEALGIYGIEEVYVERESLLRRGLRSEQLLIPVQLLDSMRMAELLETADVLVSS
jgi:tRNA 2-thiouridine synthesizing protein C